MTESSPLNEIDGFGHVWKILNANRHFMTAAEIGDALGDERETLWRSFLEDERFESSVVEQGGQGAERYQGLGVVADRIAHFLSQEGEAWSREALSARLKMLISDVAWPNIVRRLVFFLGVEELREGDSRCLRMKRSLFDSRPSPKTSPPQAPNILGVNPSSLIDPDPSSASYSVVQETPPRPNTPADPDPNFATVTTSKFWTVPHPKIAPRKRAKSPYRASELTAGSILDGRYELLSELGRGGFGVVYRARQLGLGRQVAIKVLHPPNIMTPPSVLEELNARFEQETHLLARLGHPNIVTLHDSGQLGDGSLFTVLDFIDGDPLEHVIERGPLPPRFAFRLMRQVANVLNYAHSEGVIHRDLKPANIMVVGPGTHANAMVLDFGIASVQPNISGAGVAHEVLNSKVLSLSKFSKRSINKSGPKHSKKSLLRAISLDPSRQDPSNLRITHDGQFLGTPQYMAPEQLEGVASPLIDLYAWGLVFIECLTGEPVFNQASLPEICAAQLSETPVEMPTRLRQNPLGEILSRATHKDPKHRFPNLAGLLDALEAFDIRDADRLDLFSPITKEEPRPQSWLWRLLGFQQTPKKK